MSRDFDLKKGWCYYLLENNNITNLRYLKDVSAIPSELKYIYDNISVITDDMINSQSTKNLAAIVNKFQFVFNDLGKLLKSKPDLVQKVIDDFDNLRLSLFYIININKNSGYSFDFSTVVLPYVSGKIANKKLKKNVDNLSLKSTWIDYLINNPNTKNLVYLSALNWDLFIKLSIKFSFLVDTDTIKNRLIYEALIQPLLEKLITEIQDDDIDIDEIAEYFSKLGIDISEIFNVGVISYKYTMTDDWYDYIRNNPSIRDFFKNFLRLNQPEELQNILNEFAAAAINGGDFQLEFKQLYYLMNDYSEFIPTIKEVFGPYFDMFFKRVIDKKRLYLTNNWIYKVLDNSALLMSLAELTTDTSNSELNQLNAKIAETVLYLNKISRTQSVVDQYLRPLLEKLVDILNNDPSLDYNELKEEWYEAGCPIDVFITS